MSTTTVTSTELSNVLSDYKIHLTGYDASAASSSSPASQQTPPLSNSSAPATRVPNPPDWPTQHYRIPDYRPINHELNYEERPLGSNPFEYAFLVMMFTGVVLNSTSAKIWGRTLGPYFPNLFRYQVGGEW